MVLKNFRFLSSAVLVFGLSASCAPFLVGPSDSNSSLVMGRIVVNNNYVGSLSGLLPLGVQDKGLALEVETRDGKQAFKIVTEEQGYFLLPNLPANNYHLYRVMLEGGSHSGARERYQIPLRRLPFAPVTGKITYIGTLFLDISDRGEPKIREVREESQAKSFFQQKYSASPWSAREFASAITGVAPGIPAAQAKPPSAEAKATLRSGPKADKPEWKVGYEWTYAWKRPDRSGTFTSEIIREEAFEGIPSFVVRNEKNEDYYAKDVLGMHARKTAGQLVFKRSSARVNYSWPLEVGKEWSDSYLRENIQERSSQTFNYRMVVPKMEEVTVPAGTFETFKVEVYIPRTGKLFAEYWYSPRVKKAVKEREFLDDGLREAELIGFKAD